MFQVVSSSTPRFEVGSPYCLEKHPCVVGPTMSRFILNLTQVNIVGEAGKRFQGG